MSAAASWKRGITTILSSDCDSPRVASLSRTLSAGMSSWKWTAQNEQVSSPEEHQPDVSTGSLVARAEEEEEEEEAEDGGISPSNSQFDIWNSFQGQNNKREFEEIRQSDIWSSILYQKTDQPVPAAPYIHPLAKRSGRPLSEKSLQICTESLGSETGSDGFSSYPSSEDSDGEENKEVFDGEIGRAVPSNSAFINKKRNLLPLARSRSFPPPLPSLSRQNGSSLHVRSHRNNGRLVLEAVSVKEQSNFRAQREDGRLVLTFIGNPSNDHDDSIEAALGDENDGAKTDDVSEDPGAKGDKEDEDTQGKDMGTEETGDPEQEVKLLIEELPKPCSREVSVNKLAILLTRPPVFANRSPDMFDLLGEVVIVNDAEEESMKTKTSLSQLTTMAQVTTEQPAVPAASGENAREYFWRQTKSEALTNPIAQQPIIIEHYCNDPYIISEDILLFGERPELLVLRGSSGGADYLVPLIPSCKDTRRSLRSLGPRCIPTS